MYNVRIQFRQRLHVILFIYSMFLFLIWTISDINLLLYEGSNTQCDKYVPGQGLKIIIETTYVYFLVLLFKIFSSSFNTLVTAIQ